MTSWDTNGDGVTDAVTIDADGDGVAEGFGWDADENGAYETVASDPNEDGTYDAVGYDVNQDGTVDQAAGADGTVVDTSAGGSGDGAADADAVNAMDPTTFDSLMDIQNSQSASMDNWLQPDGVSVDYNSDTNSREFTSEDGSVFDTQSDAVDDNQM